MLGINAQSFCEARHIEPFDKVAGLITGGVGGAWMCSRAVIES